MRNIWKVLVVIVLTIAVAGILVGKRNGVNTAPPTAREVAALPPTDASPTPATAPGETAVSPLPRHGSASAPETVTPRIPSPSLARNEVAPQQGPKTQPQSAPPPAPTTESAKPQAAPKPVDSPRENRAPITPPSSTLARRPQLIELGSKTCTPCKMMAPILDELRTEYGGQLDVAFWDVYEHKDKATSYRVRVIPTQVFIGTDGKEFFRHEGFFPKKDILAKFEEHGIALGGTK